MGILKVQPPLWRRGVEHDRHRYRVNFNPWLFEAFGRVYSTPDLLEGVCMNPLLDQPEENTTSTKERVKRSRNMKGTERQKMQKGGRKKRWAEAEEEERLPSADFLFGPGFCSPLRQQLNHCCLTTAEPTVYSCSVAINHNRLPSP